MGFQIFGNSHIRKILFIIYGSLFFFWDSPGSRVHITIVTPNKISFIRKSLELCGVWNFSKFPHFRNFIRRFVPQKRVGFQIFRNSHILKISFITYGSPFFFWDSPYPYYSLSLTNFLAFPVFTNSCGIQSFFKFPHFWTFVWEPF